MKFKFIPMPILICLMLFSGCASGGNNTNSDNTDKLKVLCTNFPQYDWAKEIIRGSDNVCLTLLDDSGTDYHSYQPSTDDIVTILSCDVFIYVGGESDKWVEDTLKNSDKTENMHIIRLADMMKDELLDEPEVLEGEHEHENEAAFDEHVWLSVKNAAVFCNGIANVLSESDGNNSDIYKKNAEEYISKLNSMDSNFEEKLSNAKRKSVLFADRFPFIYLMQDYNIDYDAAFPGCSSETDASFETVVSLAEEVDNEKLPAVITIENSDCNIADAIISNTKDKNQKILTLDSMQIVKREDIENGKTYLSVMEKNLDVLMEALS